MTDNARAWAEWAAAQLGDTPPEPAQEQPEEPKPLFTALDAAAPYLPKTFTPPPAIDNRPAPLPAPGMAHERKAADVFTDFINEYLR